MPRFPEFDLTGIRTQPFLERLSKVRVKDFAAVPVAGRSFEEFLRSLPNILAGPQIQEIADAVAAARRSGRAVVASLGGHVVKTGVSPAVIALMEQGFITCLAVNGAVAVHDLEVALCGATSEQVEEGLRDGTFGMAAETAERYNGAVAGGAAKGKGMGESIGEALADSPFAHVSLLACAHRLGIPVTVHVAIGTDIVHMHPSADGAAMGEASLRDFRILTAHMENLAHGGVLMNLGSAVVLPEVLLKSISLLRNRHGADFTDFLGVNFDFIQQYRSNQQVVNRVKAIGGRGISLTGHHEIMIPLLAQAIIEAEHSPQTSEP